MHTVYERTEALVAYFKGYVPSSSENGARSREATSMLSSGCPKIGAIWTTATRIHLAVSELRPNIACDQTLNCCNRRSRTTLALRERNDVASSIQSNDLRWIAGFYLHRIPPMFGLGGCVLERLYLSVYCTVTPVMLGACTTIIDPWMHSFHRLSSLRNMKGESIYSHGEVQLEFLGR